MRSLFLVLSILAFCFQSFAQTSLEEAIILNEEMQFLEETAKTESKSAPLPGSKLSQRSRKTLGESESLEETYFEDLEEDSVSTRTAAPNKKKSF